MRIQNNQLTPTSTRSSDVKSSQATRESFLGKMERNARIDKKSSNDESIISRDQLSAIASDLNSGAISPDEASSRFVDAVVDNCVGKKLSEKDLQKIASNISEFLGQDRGFQQNLEKNLRDLV